MNDSAGRNISRRGETSLGEGCRYCGAPLDPFYYFCLSCANPYKPADTVVTAARPAPLSEGELIQRKAPMVAPLFWTYFAVILFGAILSSALFTSDRPDLALFLQTSLIFVTTCVFVTMYWRSLVPQFQTFGFAHRAAWGSLLLLVPMLAINFVYFHFLQSAFDVKDAMYLDELREAGLSELTLITVFCVYPAVTEEIAFRGLLQHWLQVALAPHRAIGLAAFLFAVVHFSIPSFPYLFGVGVLLGWAKWKTESLYPSMLIHFLHNLIVIEVF